MKNKTGRPKKFDSVEHMEGAIQLYFDGCDSRDVPYTVAGLALALGLTTQGLMNYEHTEGYEMFFSTVKTAKQRIEANMIERGLAGQLDRTFSIFLAKANFGYSDQPKDTNTERRIVIEFENDDDNE